jgi:hypothetical protein
MMALGLALGAVTLTSGTVISTKTRGLVQMGDAPVVPVPAPTPAPVPAPDAPVVA